MASGTDKPTMNYWVPSGILILVLLVLVAQLPWGRPRKAKSNPRLDLALPDLHSAAEERTAANPDARAAALTKS